MVSIIFFICRFVFLSFILHLFPTNTSVSTYVRIECIDMHKRIHTYVIRNQTYTHSTRAHTYIRLHGTHTLHAQRKASQSQYYIVVLDAYSRHTIYKPSRRRSTLISRTFQNECCRTNLILSSLFLFDQILLSFFRIVFWLVVRTLSTLK